MALGSVSNFWMNGRPSGLPENIEDQLANARRMQRVDPLEAQKEDKLELKETYASLDETLGTLHQAAQNISQSDTFNARLGSSSNEGVAGVKADNNAQVGSANLEVISLATEHNLQIGFKDGTGELDGISDPDDQSLIGDDVDVSFDHLGQSFSYSTADNPTLNELAQAIDEDDNGVQATVAKLSDGDDPNYVLQLKSEETGGGNKRIDNVSVDGLYAGETSSVNEAQDGENASFYLDGALYTRSSNTVDDVVDGLDIELKSAGSTQIAVQEDISSIEQGIAQFVDANNSAQNFIDKASDYDPDEDISGPLSGSSLVRSVDSKMTRNILDPVSGTGDNAFQYLTEIGISFNREGMLEVDADTLGQALSTDADGVKKLFAGDKGVAGKLANDLSAYTHSRDGILTYKMETIDDQVKRLDARIEREEEGVERYLERQVSQFTAMENAIAEYQSVQDQLESIAESWSSKE